MNSTIQWITIVASFLFLIQVITLTAKNKLHDKYAFIWIVFAIIGVLSAFSLPYLNNLAALLGISYMPSLIFTLAFLIVLMMLTYQTVLLSKHERTIKQLVQEIGILDQEIRKLKRGSE